MIRFIDPTIKTKLITTYIKLYSEVRLDKYPLEHGFLVTKIRFQEYIIDEMFKNPTKAKEIISAYTQIKEDKTVQEKALKNYEESSKYEAFMKSVNKSKI